MTPPDPRQDPSDHDRYLDASATYRFLHDIFGPRIPYVYADRFAAMHDTTMRALETGDGHRPVLVDRDGVSTLDLVIALGY